MSKSSCRFVVTKKDDCCYKTTTETVVGLYGVATPAFPPSSTKDSVHVVRYDDALVTYVYNGTAWVETTNTPVTSSVIPGTLVDNGDGTYTWTDTATTFVIDTIDRVLSTVVYSPATQDFTFTWSNGDTTVVDLTALLNTYSLIDGNNTAVTGDGVSTPWEVNGYGITDNADGTYTVTLPDGTTTFAIDTNETVTNIAGNTYTNEAGTPQAIVQIVSNSVVGNNLTTTVNGVVGASVALPADIVTTLAAALDTTNPLAPTLVITYVNEDGSNGVQNVNLAALLDNTNTTYTVTNNNDGTITLVGSDGNNTLVDICAVVASGCPTTLTANVDGSFTFVGSDGTPVTIPAPAAAIPSAVTNIIVGNRIATHTPGGGTAVDINETITTIVNNGDGTATFTNEAGVSITFPIGGVDVVDNADGTYTVTLADGSVVTIGDTSVSTLVDNLDGTYTYTDEAGVVTTFDTTGVITTITNTITGNKIADYTSEDGTVYPINESVTSFSSITNGYQFIAEDGTVYPFTFTFDNTTPSTPQLLVNYGATTVSSIPLNSYDVNITTTGGFVLNPLTDEITITETDGETHVIDLSYLRSTVTSTDGSVEIVTSVNPDGSTNHDLGVKAHTNQVENVPYTGTELPTTAGVNVGDTKSVQFNDGTVVDYTWDGTNWVLDFEIEPIDPTDETTCTTYDEKILVKKTDGSIVARPSGSIKDKEVFPTGNYTILAEDNIIYAVGGSTITLPSCVGNCSEKTIYRDACSDGLITVLPPAGQKIDGTHLSRTLEVGRGAFTYECVNGEWRIKSEFFEKDQAGATFSLLNSNDANVQVSTLDGLPYSVDWGDGTNSGSIASGVATSHAYATPFTGDVTIIKTCGVAPIYVVSFNSGNWDFDIIDLNQFPNLTVVAIFTGVTTGNISNLPSGLTTYSNGGQNTTTGDIANLPSGLTVYGNDGQNTTSGDISNLPSGLTHYGNNGQNTTTGDIANLPSGLTVYGNYGQNTTTGDIANLPIGLTHYYNIGQNTTSGDISNLPSGLTTYSNGGQNTTSGDISNLPSGLTVYGNDGQNTTTGDIANLPSGLTTYYNIGQNTTSGDISNLPIGLTRYSNGGQNTTTGDIANLPIGLTHYYNLGQNTTSGDIANLPSVLTNYTNQGLNTVSDYTGGNLNSGITYFDSNSLNATFNSTEVDDLLIELATTLPGLSYVRITGGAAAPTAASLAARNAIIASGATLITN